MHRILILITLLVLATSVQAQQRYFLWYVPTSDTINGIGIGLADITFKGNPEDYLYQRNGIRVEAIGLGIGVMFYNGMGDDSTRYHRKIRNLRIADSIKDRSEINGLSLSLTGSFSNSKMNGISLNGLGHISNECNGFSAAIWLNDCFYESNGVQLAFMNRGLDVRGFQIGGINYGYKTQGLQIGLVNGNTLGTSVQIGLVNLNKKGEGFQIGLWNINAKRQFPFFNW